MLFVVSERKIDPPGVGLVGLRFVSKAKKKRKLRDPHCPELGQRGAVPQSGVGFMPQLFGGNSDSVYAGVIANQSSSTISGMPVGSFSGHQCSQSSGWAVPNTVNPPAPSGRRTTASPSARPTFATAAMFDRCAMMMRFVPGSGASVTLPVR